MKDTFFKYRAQIAQFANAAYREVENRYMSSIHPLVAPYRDPQQHAVPDSELNSGQTGPDHATLMHQPGKEAVVRLQFSVELNYGISPPGADFIFNIHAAHTPRQKVLREDLQLSQSVRYHVETEPVSGNRYFRLHAESGPLQVRYEATVDIDHHVAAPDQLAEVSISDLPSSVLPYIYPSRYCQSDRLQKLAFKEFGNLSPGYHRAQAICQWVQQRVSFQSNSSNVSTSALDTVVDRVGVCRDFTHLMIALCRAVNLPARFTTGIDYGADPALGPTDFHAYVEVYLNHGWYIFDPSGAAIPMGFVRFATGRDAADVAFATMFGSVASGAPLIHIQVIPNAQGRLVQPEHVQLALSTDGPETLARERRDAAG